MSSKCKRLAIYVFYDRDGKADRYIYYFLAELKKCIDELVVVCNGTIDESSRANFFAYTEHLLLRENEGLDLAAYRHGLKYIGWEKLQNFDEVLLLNDTIMGPVYPFQEMFDTMDKKDLDFWGITKHDAFELNPFDSPYGHTPAHIQSYFMAFRNSLLKESCFQKYWNDLPDYKTYHEVVGKHEVSFTKFLEDLGFKWDVYVKTTDMQLRHNQPIMTYPKELIQDKRCPIFKKRVFFQDYEWVITNSIGRAAVDLLDYLKNENMYDIDMIYENIIRICNLPDLVKNLHWNYILPSSVKTGTIETSENDIALIMHVHYTDLLPKTLSWILNMPLNAHIYVFTNTPEKKVLIENIVKSFPHTNIFCRITQNRGRDVGSLIIGSKDFIMDYKYVCFVHDKKSSHVYPQLEGEDFALSCFENVICSKEYICNIIQKFEENPRLGIAFPPMVNHGSFFSLLGNEWGTNYDNTVQLAQKLGIHVKIDRNSIMAPLGDYFWFRPEALSSVFNHDWTWEDLPQEPVGIDGSLLHAIERIYAYAAQENGYYAAYIQNENYAALAHTNLDYYARTFNQNLRIGNYCGYFHQMSAKTKELVIGTVSNDEIKTLKDIIENLTQEKHNYASYVDQLEEMLQIYGKNLSLIYKIKERLKKFR